jgi:hypothetical protein
MDVRDGFIVGIYNYCDEWCERCALTHRCRMFVDLAAQDCDDGRQKSGELLRKTGHSQRAVDSKDDRGEPHLLVDDPLAWVAEDGPLPEGLEPATQVDPFVIAHCDDLQRVFHCAKHAGGVEVRHAVRALERFTIFISLKMMRTLLAVMHDGDRTARGVRILAICARRSTPRGGCPARQRS